MSILGFSALHFAMAIGLFFHAFGRGMSQFDTGEMPTLLDRVCDAGIGVLWFPFMQIAEASHISGPGLAEWLLFLASSLLWGTFLYAFIIGIWRLWHLGGDMSTSPKNTK